ncbi:phage tail tape measure protein [Engelhardtia mirabilis]
MADEAEQAGLEVNRLEVQTDRLGTTASRTAVFATSLAVAFAAFAGGREAVRTLADFERGLIGVGKTADLEGSALSALGDDIRDLSREVPATTAELLEIAQAAGQLGVKGRSDILAFTETLAKLGGASDLAGEEAAQTLARLLNITGESASEVGRLGSVIVALGNSQAATESQIARSASEVAKATAAYEVSSAQASALGAALAALGVQAELGGSTVGRSFRAIDAAVRSGGPALEALERLTGRGAADLQVNFRSDPVEVFRDLIRGLRDLGREGGDATAALESIGLTGDRLLAVIPTLAQGYDVLTSSLATANAEVENATALDKEAAKAVEALSNQWKLLGNSVESSVTQFGDSTGALSDAVRLTREVVDEVAGLDTRSSGASLSVEALATAVRSLGGALAGVAVGGGIQALGTVPRALSSVARIAASNPFVALGASAGALAGLFASASAEARELSEELEGVLNTGDQVEAFFRRLSDLEVGIGRAETEGDLDRQLEKAKQVQAELTRFADSLAAASAPDRLSVSSLRGEGISGEVLDQVLDAARIDFAQRFRDFSSSVAEDLASELEGVASGASRRISDQSIDGALTLADQLTRTLGLDALDASGVDLSPAVNAVRDFTELADELEVAKRRIRDASLEDDGAGRRALISSATRDLERLRPELAQAAQGLAEVVQASFDGVEIGVVDKDTVIETLDAIRPEATARVEALTRDLEERAAAGGEQVGGALGENIKSGLEGSFAAGSARQFLPLERFFAGLQFETALAGEAADAQSDLRAARDGAAAAFQSGRLDLIPQSILQAIALTRLQTEAERELAEQRAESADLALAAQPNDNRAAAFEGEVDRFSRSLQEQFELVGKSREQQEELLLIRDLNSLALAAEAEGLDAVAVSIRGQEDAIVSLLQRLQDERAAAELVNQISEGLAGAGTDFVDQFIEDLDRVEDALEVLANRVRRIFLEALLFDPLDDFLGSFLKDFFSGFGSGIGGGGSKGGSSFPGSAANSGTGGVAGGGSSFPGSSANSGLVLKSLPAPEIPPGLPTGPGFATPGSFSGAKAGSSSTFVVNVTQNFSGQTDRATVDYAAQQVGKRARRAVREGR